DPLRFGKLGDELAEFAIEERIGCAILRREFFNLFEGNRAQFRAANLVDAAARRDLPQPVREMRRTLDRFEASIKLKENVLRDFFGAGSIVEEVVSKTEHHRLVI